MYKIEKKFLLRIIIIGSIILIVNIFFYQICITQGDSMLPTLKNGKVLLMKKYNMNLYYNDIVIIKKNNKVIIKRLIGLPNDTIQINKFVYVNENKFDDLYIENAGNATETIYLKKQEYFVLGDNRQASIDSRFDEVGIIHEDEILGKIIWF